MLVVTDWEVLDALEECLICGFPLSVQVFDFLY
jgi:hypothetical protein